MVVRKPLRCVVPLFYHFSHGKPYTSVSLPSVPPCLSLPWFGFHNVLTELNQTKRRNMPRLYKSTPKPLSQRRSLSRSRIATNVGPDDFIKSVICSCAPSAEITSRRELIPDFYIRTTP